MKRESVVYLSFLAVACVFGASATKTDVLVISGTSLTNNSDKSVLAYAKYFAEVADTLSISARLTDETALPDDLRSAADAVVLGFNPSIRPATLSRLSNFVSQGGRLLVACHLPQGVDRILGLEQIGKVTQRDALDPELAGILPVKGRLPPADSYAAFTRWGAYNAPVVKLTGPGEVIAHWAKEGGVKRDEPAVVATPAGLFISYIWFRGGSPAQRDLLEGVFRALLPGKTMTRKPDPVWRTEKPAPIPAKEHRGVWSHARGLFASGKNWDETCALLQKRGVTDLYMLSSWAGAAFYESDVIPRAPHVAKYGDLMRQATDAAHAHGIRFHAWMVNWRIDQYSDKALVARERAAGKLQEDCDGNPQDWYCPSAPENRAREVARACEIATRGVDGVMFDFIRFGNVKYCFCQRCRRLFEERVGSKGINWPADIKWRGAHYEAWFDFRAELISKTVEEASRRIRLANPRIIISASVLPHSLFRYEHAEKLKLKYRPWTGVGQDSALWLKRGWVDYVCPMNYSQKDWEDVKKLAELQESIAPGRVYPGIGLAGWIRPGDDAARLAEQQDAIRAAGCSGSTIYVLDDDRAEFLEKWW